MMSFFLTVQKWCALQRHRLIVLFQFLYVLIWILIAVALYTVFFDLRFLPYIVSIAKLAGQAAVLVFLLVTLPGIAGRFGLKHPLISMGVMFRRYAGILVSFLVIFHWCALFLFPTIASGQTPTTVPAYISSAIVANGMLILLMLTSNNWSVQKLGKWWKRLHRLVYVIYWLIFLHLFFLGSYKWGSLIGIFAVLEIVSLVFSAIQAQRNVIKTPEAV